MPISASRRQSCFRSIRPLLLLGLLGLAGSAGEPVAAEDADILDFLRLASPDKRESAAAAEALTPGWRDGYAALIVDLARLFPPSRRARSGVDFSGEGAGGGAGDRLGEAAGPSTPSAAPAGGSGGSPVRRRLIRFLESRTGQRFGDDLDKWRRWLWKQDYAPHPRYAEFKGGVYGNIDPRMRAFFPANVPATIRLDEIDWGGVRVDGIPPLDHPKTIPAAEADYLKDAHIVFGVSINGMHRAYPKRILAWHEMARDRLGDRELALVYCTLCGTVIPWDATIGEQRFTLGTSGLLYRSNKLMYDQESGSLWSTVYGKPVVGSLALSGLKLTSHPVVTTTWGEWKALHPKTTVLSLNTGHQRDYREGAAYRDYFATDRIMFEVPQTDDRLKNKDEVLVLPFTWGGGDPPLVIAADYLEEHRLFQLERAGRQVVVLTTPGGANRVFERGARRFDRWLDEQTVVDDAGAHWRIEEQALVSADGATRLPRLPAHRAFWFGWYAQNPHTELIR